MLTVGHCPGGSQGNAMTLAQLSAADDSTDAVADYVLSDDEGDDMLPPGHRLFGRGRAAAGGNLDDGDNDDGVMGGDFESDEVLIAARSLSLCCWDAGFKRCKGNQSCVPHKDADQSTCADADACFHRLHNALTHARSDRNPAMPEGFVAVQPPATSGSSDTLSLQDNGSGASPTERRQKQQSRPPRKAGGTGGPKKQKGGKSPGGGGGGGKGKSKAKQRHEHKASRKR